MQNLSVSGQVIELDPAVSRDQGVVSVAVESGQAELRALARKAFSLHGRFMLDKEDRAALRLRFEPSGRDAVLLRIKESSGKEQVRKVHGADLEDAVLRACDLVVEWATGLKGFFAGKLAFVGKRGGVSEIYTANLLFSDVRALTSNRALVTGPDWSPDGMRLLYTTYHKAGFPDIYQIDLLAGVSSPVATYKGTNSGGRYSPDGRRIAMVLSGTGNSELWVADRNGGDRRRLTNNDSLEASPDWSPDGRRLVFTSDQAGRPQLYEVAVSGGPMRRLATGVSRYCAEPACNPVKAGQIAFTAAVGGAFEVFLYDARTRSSRQLTRGPGDALESCWLNDGRHLVYTQRRGGRTQLMLLDTVSGKTSALHRPNVGDTSSATFVY
ncbi:MAG: biopolymer transporter Tol [Coraliomargarita sp.]